MMTMIINNYFYRAYYKKNACVLQLSVVKRNKTISLKSNGIVKNIENDKMMVS